jgi:hypothetical protein
MTNEEFEKWTNEYIRDKKWEMIYVNWLNYAFVTPQDKEPVGYLNEANLALTIAENARFLLCEALKNRLNDYFQSPFFKICQKS